MQLKVNHYASKEIKQSVTFGMEAVFTEFFLAFLGGVFAYLGYRGNIAILFIGSLVASMACFIAAVYSIYEYFRYKKVLEAADLSDTENGNEKS